MKKFSDIIGYDKVKQHLIQTVKDGNLPHALIIEGENGSGKKTIADAYAAAIMCDSKSGEACGMCMSCLQADTGNHPDIIHIRHEKSKYTVDEMRAFNSDVAIKPYSSDHKVYIIEDAGNMNDQAQNAILKTIEEPPEYAVIILLAENRGVFLQTILSRCVTLSLKPIASEQVKEYLCRSLQIPDYLADVSASFSGGNIGRALRYASSEDFSRMKEEVVHLLKYVDDMTFGEIMDAVTSLSQNKGNTEEFLDLCMMWFRDVLLYKATQNINGLCFKEEISALKNQASKRSFENLDNIIKAFDKAKLRLNANVNFEVTIELLILTVKDN